MRFLGAARRQIRDLFFGEGSASKVRANSTTVRANSRPIADQLREVEQRISNMGG